MRFYADIVEITETISRRRANALLEAGYELLDIDVVSFAAEDRKTGRVQTWRRHEYVIGRSEGQRPISEVLDSIKAREDAERAARAANPGPATVDAAEVA